MFNTIEHLGLIYKVVIDAITLYVRHVLQIDSNDDCHSFINEMPLSYVHGFCCITTALFLCHVQSVVNGVFEHCVN